MIKRLIHNSNIYSLDMKFTVGRCGLACVHACRLFADEFNYCIEIASRDIQLVGLVGLT